MNSTTDNAKVVIISQADTFLAKSLVTKFEGASVTSVFVKADIAEIKPHMSDAALIILFMSEELEPTQQSPVQR